MREHCVFRPQQIRKERWVTCVSAAQANPVSATQSARHRLVANVVPDIGVVKVLNKTVVTIDAKPERMRGRERPRWISVANRKDDISPGFPRRSFEIDQAVAIRRDA